MKGDTGTTKREGRKENKEARTRKHTTGDISNQRKEGKTEEKTKKNERRRN